MRMTWKKPSGLVSWMLVFKHVGPSCATAEDTQVGGDIVLDMQEALANGKLQEQGSRVLSKSLIGVNVLDMTAHMHLRSHLPTEC